MCFDWHPSSENDRLNQIYKDIRDDYIRVWHPCTTRFRRDVSVSQTPVCHWGRWWDDSLVRIPSKAKAKEMSARIPVTSHDKSMNMITKLASIQIRSQKRVGCLIRAGIGKWRAAGLVVHASTAQSTAHRAKAHAVATGNTQLRQCTAQRPADGFAAKNKKSQTQLGRVRQFQSRQQSGEHNKKS